MIRACYGPVHALRRLLLALALMYLCQSSRALWAATDAVTPYRVRIWQMDDGLPQNSVHAIAQSADGFLWIGTHAGLARFDGVRFTTLDEKAAPELKQGWITALCAATDGSLWIACDGSGVTRLKDGTFSHFSETNGLPSNQTRCLFEAADGAIWIGSEGGLARYQNGQFKTFTQKTGLGDNSVRAICEDHQGAIRVATLRGLSRLENDEISDTMNFGIGSVANALKAVCEDARYNIWVSSNEGVMRAGPQGRIAYGVKEGLPDRRATAIYEDHNGRVWVGTYNGLACLVDGRVVAKPLNDAGFGDLVYAIFEDREENLWVGGRDGLYRLRPARFTTLTTQEGLTSNNAMSICEDTSGTMYIATWGGGLNFLEGDRFNVINSTDGLGHDSVLALHPARDGSLWVGMDFDGRLHRLQKDGDNTSVRQVAMLNAAIRVIHEDREGALWVGTRKGLNVLRHDKLTTYTTTNGLAGNDVMAMHEDAAGRVWVGTDGGLSLWQHGKFRNFTTQQGLAHNGVNGIYEDAQQTLWIGTKGGLNRFKGDTFTTYTTAQGLFSDEIYEILEDDFGYFWISCRKGLFRISKRELDEVDRGHLKVVTSIVFGKADGMASVQCNGVAKPAAWKARDGRIWFPTIRGAVAVDCSLKTNDRPPPVIIEEVRADQRTLGRGGFAPAEELSFTVPPGRGELEVRYTALSFRSPDKNLFKYMLEGMDPGWIEAGDTRAAHYNNITPGSYRFRVIACNNDGVWNEAGAMVALVFQPHYWQTWWFKLAIPAAVGLALALLFRFRVKRLKEIENLRIQIAADLHDDVGAGLTKVAMVTESMDRATPETDNSKPHIRNIAQTTREIVKAMDEIVWTINPKNDNLENLASYIFQYAQDFFQDSGVRCRMDLPVELPAYSLSTQERHNLFMAVKEALNNILKHARATEVRLGLMVNGARLTILIADDGCGFSPDQVDPSRNGLTNMKQRLERIGGRLLLKSEPGTGTSIRMEADAK